MNKSFLHTYTFTRGAAMLLFIIFFTIAMSAVATAFSRSVVSDVKAGIQMKSLLRAESAADAGVEDMAYRFIASLTPDSTETIVVNDVSVTTDVIADGTNNTYTLTATSTTLRSTRSASLLLQVGSGASFNFGVQTGNGGFEMSNGSSVQGNVFSNGPISKVGGGTATIYGDVISAGPSGFIKDIRATGTARANRIETSYIEGDAYFVTESANTVLGTRYSGSPDESPTDLPISDTQIEEMKQDVVDNGTIIASTDADCSGGEYFIQNDTTLGFVKIECDLRVKKQGSATILTLDGPIWVEGDVIFEGGPDIVVDGSVGNRTVPIIADNESDRITSSRISIENGTTFTGSGSPKSHVILISQNEDAEVGSGSEDAIFVGQSSEGDLLVYAAHGRVDLGNSISLKEVTGYLIQLNNSAEVIYESGLVNLLFTSGPGGGFSILGWQDVD